MSALDDVIARDSAPQQASPLDAIIARDSAQAATPGPAATAASATQPSAGQPQGQWQVPGAVTMGAGDIIKGGTQGIVHGLAWLADKVAPDSQFARDANAAIPQIQQTITQQDQAYNAQRAAQGGSGFDWGRAGGQVAAAAPLAMAMPTETGAMGTAVTGALSGAATAGLQPVGQLPPGQTYADAKLGQMGTGALTGAIAAPLTAAAGSAIRGVGDAAQRRLAQAGVTMTPGQILGGAWAKAEDQMTSMPIIGDFIRNAKQRSVQSFNRATYNEALAPIGAHVARDIEPGSDAIAAVRNEIGHVYDSIEPRATFIPDQNFAADVAGIRTNLAQTAPGAVNQFDNIVQNQVTAKAAANQGVLNGAQWGNTRSEINTIARNQVLGNATPDNRALADALGNLNDAINAGVGRSSPPDILPTLQNANAAWARYKQIETAAGSTGASNNGNVFTAAQFQNAVRRGSTAGQKATNSGLSGQLGADAQSVLGSKYPDSGTPGRAALMGLIGALGGGGAVASGMAVPAAAGTALATLPYTATGQRLAQALMMSRPAGAVPVGNALARYGVPLAPALGTALLNNITPSKN